VSSVLRHVRDVGGMGVASGAATVADAVVFASLLRLSPLPLVADVALAALVGAFVHFSLCRVWVFSRFNRSLLESLQRYAVMSGIALCLHAEVTTLLARALVPELAWLVSKGAVFALWCYPASRFLVFGRSEAGGGAGEARAPSLRGRELVVVEVRSAESGCSRREALGKGLGAGHWADAGPERSRSRGR
jgi:putative flippase GtrA